MKKAAPKKKVVVKKKPAPRKSENNQIYTKAKIMEAAGILRRKNQCTYAELLDLLKKNKVEKTEDPRFEYKDIKGLLLIELKRYAATVATRKVSNKAANGGARAGAGRKKGAATKKTREIADKLAEDGEQTPLEYMLETMRETPDKLRKMHKDGDIDSAEFTLRMQDLTKRRDNAAEKAAPYIHPRLATIEAKVEDATQERWLAIMAAHGL